MVGRKRHSAFRCEAFYRRLIAHQSFMSSLELTRSSEFIEISCCLGLEKLKGRMSFENRRRSYSAERDPRRFLGQQQAVCAAARDELEAKA
jgi:hypothetical protein